MNTDTSSYKFTNQLINESSPYLLQHAHNPVNWYPWGDEALALAKAENKLIIISIGYAACHWCHVMEHQSFENEQVAAYMNEHFVCIKVDREERPDIDQVYMNVVQLLTGSGGWPLNCITLPDGRPIYGGTYFTPEQWVGMLNKVQDFVKKEPEKTEQQALALTQGVQQSELIEVNPVIEEYSLNDLHTVFDNWEGMLDFVHGGTKGAPKFPLPVGYEFLLHYHSLTEKEAAIDATLLTLNKMANGGIYDQIGGGFARYSVDEYWKAPHFEKMLYDNSQLVSLYAKSYQFTKNQYFKTIVEETLSFIEKELTAPKGGFYASLDADSEGEEGKFYTWTYEEFSNVIGFNADLIKAYYNISVEGNWENGRNILFKSGNDKYFAEQKELSLNQLLEEVTNAKNVLLKARSQKIRPALDDKIVTAWNALMIKAYVDAYKATGNADYFKTAVLQAEFLLKQVKEKDGTLNRIYKNEKASINAFLDDYAFMIEACVALYQVTFNEKWIYQAKDFLAYTLLHFYDSSSGMFYYTSDLDPDLIARKMEVADNVIPSSNSVMAKNLFLLGHYFADDDYIEKSYQMLNNVKESTYKSGPYFANWDILMAWFAFSPFEVAIVGNDYKKICQQLNQYYLPSVFILGGKDEGTLPLLKGKLVEGKTIIYVCKNKTCKLPVHTVEEAFEQLGADGGPDL